MLQDIPTNKQSNKHNGTSVITQKQNSMTDINTKKFNLCNNTSVNDNQNYIYVRNLNVGPSGRAV